MGAFLVVPADPAADRSPGLREILKQMLPHALLLQAPEEVLDHAVLLRGVGGDELPAETVAPESRPEPATLEYQSVVAPENGSVSLGTQGTEAGDAGFHFGHRQAVLADRLLHGSLTLDDADDQC